MRVFLSVCLYLSVAAAVIAQPGGNASRPFAFQDGDRVVFLGDTWVEREQRDGYIETMLSGHLDGKQVIFRNLAWSGDTVLGRSRASFDPAEKGYERLIEQLEAVKPTVVFLGYGMAESFGGDDAKFRRDLNTLLDAIVKISGEKVRFVLITPLYHEALGTPLPDPAAHNRQLEKFAAVTRSIARERSAWLVDLFNNIETYHKQPGARALTDNGIHPTPFGFWQIATYLETALFSQSTPLVAAPQGSLITDADGSPGEELRHTIIAKNDLFFYRWRPQNQTYLFGFRRHEQGRNAKEIPMFDPLISEQEQKIFQLAAKARAEAGTRTRQTPAATRKKEEKAADFTQNALPHPTFDLADGLEATLWAENPNLAKPIQINFDPQGRLWVASSSVYPQIQPGHKADDKILILEDTNGDGKADKTTVFADGLLIPTGVIPGDGGAYVANSTELLFYKDTNGDGRADEKHIMLSGFGTEDTHHILHTLRWGFDGQLYMNQSIYIHSHLETPHGVVRLNSGGTLNLRPATQELGVHMKGLVNSWGHHFDRYGQSFETDGAGGEGINWVIPQAMFVTYEGARRVLHSVSPGSYPKFCSLEVIESEAFPDDWQGTMVTCDFRAHRVVRFSIDDQGAGYVTTELPDVMRSTNVTFRPIDVKLGPDGAIYIADWSNPIIQHGEVDFRDPRRDHEHGRIWKVTHKGRQQLQKPNLLAANNARLLDNLLSKNGQLRQASRRVLTERGAAIKADLAAWTVRQSTELGQLEGLWMYQSLDTVNAELLRKLLAAKDGRVRTAATRVLSFWHSRLPDALSLVAARVHDEFPRARVEAVRAAATMPGAETAGLVLSALDHPLDRFLDYAIWLSINDLAEPWVRAIESGDWKWEGREKQLEFGLKAIEPAQAGRVLAKILKEKPLDREGNGPWLDLIAAAGSAEQAADLLLKTLDGGFTESGAIKALKALSEAARIRQVTPASQRERVAELFKTPNNDLKAGAIRLVGQWKLQKFAPDLLQIGAASSADPAVRAASFQALREMGGPEAARGLAELSAKKNEPGIRIEAVKALAALDLGKAVPLAVDLLPDVPNEEAALNFWRALLANKGAAPAFAQAIPKSGLPAPVVKAGLRVAREGGRNEPNLVLALARNIDAEDEAKNLSPEELNRLLAFVREKGDPARGELIYRRPELGCVTCHSIGGVGGKVGPDMTSIGASAQLDYLIESVQFPNRKVKEGFHAVMIETKDDQELAGVLVRETSDQLVLRDASNREVSVPKNNINKRSVGGSIMPAGLIDSLNPQDQADLYRFLSELGKPGRYDASKGNVARLWQVMPRTLDVSQFTDDKVIGADNTGTVEHNQWQPVATLVDGQIPRAQLQKILKDVQWRDPDAIYAKTRFELARAGQVRLTLPPMPKAQLWVDGKPVELKSDATVQLEAGSHTLAVKIDGKALPEFLSASTSDGTFLNN